MVGKKILFILIILLLISAGIYSYFRVYKADNNSFRNFSDNPNPKISNSDQSEFEDEQGADNKSLGDFAEVDLGGIGTFSIPNDFKISLYAQDLGKVRVLKFDPNGNLLASLIDKGRVVVFNDINNDGKGEMKTLVIDLKLPHGIAVKCDGKLVSKGPCDLYIAETDKVSLYSYNPDSINAVFVRKLFNLPTDNTNNHFTRTIEIFKYKGEEKLFTSVGSSCNVCNEKSSQRAAVLISNLDGSNLRTFSSGLRNSVFLEQKPGTEEIWATENSRDQLGDDVPPDEINVLQEDGFYGWPICYDDKIQDKSFDDSDAAAKKCESSMEPKVKLQAHSAALGLDFVPDSWPSSLKGNVLVAFHGSWNRTVPTGYKIVRIILDKNGNYKDTSDFITGWIEGKNVSGRPVDIESNGSDVYISDDKAGVIYKVSPK